MSFLHRVLKCASQECLGVGVDSRARNHRPARTFRVCRRFICILTASSISSNFADNKGSLMAAALHHDAPLAEAFDSSLLRYLQRNTALKRQAGMLFLVGEHV